MGRVHGAIQKKFLLKSHYTYFILNYKVYCFIFKEILILYLFIKFNIFVDLFEILMVLEGGSTIIFDLSRVILWICRFFMAHSTEILRGFSWEFSGSWRNEVKNSKLIPYSYSLTSSSTVMNISWELVKTLITGMYHCIRT